MDYLKESILIACLAVTFGCILFSYLVFRVFRLFFPEGIISGDAIRPAVLIATIIGSLSGLLLALVTDKKTANFNDLAVNVGIAFE